MQSSKDQFNFLKKKKNKLGMVVRVCSSGTLRAESGEGES